MKLINTALCLILPAVIAGCASRSATVLNEPVGPDLARPRINVNAGYGQLVVYSALDVANPVESDFPTHANYDIYDADGHFVSHVDNRSGPFDQNPASVPLQTGRYQVKARATNHGLVTVPVIVREHETTILDLDASHFRQHKPTGAGQWVRLPTGEVIGMKTP